MSAPSALRPHTLALLTGLCLLASAPMAAAKPDYRPQDRFFFALYGGAALGRAESIALSVGANNFTAQRPSGYGPMFGFETSYWPCDFAAVGLDVEAFTVPTPSPQFTALTTDLGLLLVLAAPLRYVQPYAGVWGGLRVSWLAGQSSSLLPMAHPLAGLNFYINRNLRVFLQWQYVPLDYQIAGDKAQISYAGGSTHLLGTGVRWSPDFFHASRPAMKFDIVWWSALFAVAAWGAVSWIGASR